MQKKINNPLFLLFLLLLLSPNVIWCELYTVYTTWQKKPESTMTIHWITDKEDRDLPVFYQKIGTSSWSKEIATSTPLPEGYHQFYIHTAEILTLEPDTTYLFKIGLKGSQYKFKTMPLELKESVNFVVGGDIYHDEISAVEKMSKEAIRFNPRFALIGGDIAYAADKYARYPENFERWLEFLISWNKIMVTSDGVLVPILPVTSNEDTKGRYNRTPKDAPFFYSLFAMPGKQGHQVLDFGKWLSVWFLDSGHTHPIYGRQAHWLELTMKMRKQVPLKFAIYHVPAYPSYRPFTNKTSSKLRKYWVPTFEKYGLNVSFEHHDHDYKRTHLISQNKIDPKGVLYLGDGGWGVTKPRIPSTPDERWYLAKTASKSHVIIGTIFPDMNVLFLGLDSSGKIFDEYLLYTN